jgi:hypothetical protein
MSVTLKIRFPVRKKDLKKLWVPVVVELLATGTQKPLCFAAEDFDRDIKDEEDKQTCFYEIPGLPTGKYSLSILDFHTGHTIVQGKSVDLKDEKAEYSLLERYRVPKQTNTFGMDLVADAPYRIEKSHSYLPVIVLVKDIKPQEIKVRSIEIYNYSTAEEFLSRRLPQEAIYRVFDGDGKPVEREGRPSFLRFDPGEDYETVMDDPWFRIILLHKDRLQVMQGDHWGYKNVRYLQYLINIRYRKILNDNDSKQFVFRTLVPDWNLPQVSGWYYGDTHYHSEYTLNPYEYGGPLSMTSEVARAIGLSWVTVTDHSYGLSHPRTQAEQEQGNRWQSYQRAIKETNERHGNVLLLGAEEITVRSHFAGLHLLSFGNPFIEDSHPLGFGSLGMKEALDRMTEGKESGRGFIFAAHPASSGYTWEEEDYQVATDPRYSQIFLGLQLFNEKILYEQTTRSSMDRDFLDPFAMLDETYRKKKWWKELDEGVQRHWVERLLLPSLREYEKKKNLRKFFILGGSDAHMDFNYAFRPHFAFLIHYLYDNAFGKVRTLAYLPKADGSPLTEESLLWALRNGNTLATDGPITLFSLRSEGSDRIYRLGETVLLPPGRGLEMSLEWKSSPEFGPVDKISLYLGTTTGETDITNQIHFPGPIKMRYGLEGSIKQVFSEWKTLPCYLRIEASSGIDAKNRFGLFHCVTNPIWVVKGRSSDSPHLTEESRAV